MTQIVLETDLKELSLRRGKVRDIYDLGDAMLLVSTDRISAFDWVLPSGIPDKGRVLTQLSNFWFSKLAVPHHLIETDVTKMDGLPQEADREALAGRSVLVRKTEVGRSIKRRDKSVACRCRLVCKSVTVCPNRSSLPRPKRSKANMMRP